MHFTPLHPLAPKTPFAQKIHKTHPSPAVHITSYPAGDLSTVPIIRQRNTLSQIAPSCLGTKTEQVQKGDGIV